MVGHWKSPAEALTLLMAITTEIVVSAGELRVNVIGNPLPSLIDEPSAVELLIETVGGVGVGVSVGVGVIVGVAVGTGTGVEVGGGVIVIVTDVVPAAAPLRPLNSSFRVRVAGTPAVCNVTCWLVVPGGITIEPVLNAHSPSSAVVPVVSSRVAVIVCEDGLLIETVRVRLLPPTT